ncbi:hypothetical protein [Nocardia brasiliensis]
MTLSQFEFHRARRAVGRNIWQARALPDARALPANPVPMGFERAQHWCNFVLWQPVVLPPDCSMSVGTLRFEAPPGRECSPVARIPWSDANTSSYRVEVIGDGRKLRIKQFLYDWAFPALDHPNLWLSAATATPIDDRYVCWFGRDYLGRSGAGIRRARTSVEFSVLAGHFSTTELRTTIGSLRASSEFAAHAIHRTRLAELSYWARYPVAPVRAPNGLWKDLAAAPTAVSWTADPGVTGEKSERASAPSSIGSFRVDSAIEYRSNDARLCRNEIVYSAGPDRGHELRYATWQLPCSLSPERGPHPGSYSTALIAGQLVYFAFVDERFGPWDAIWQYPATGQVIRLLSTSGTRLSRAWFIDAVTCCVTASSER